MKQQFLKFYKFIIPLFVFYTNFSSFAVDGSKKQKFLVQKNFIHENSPNNFENETKKETGSVAEIISYLKEVLNNQKTFFYDTTLLEREQWNLINENLDDVLKTLHNLQDESTPQELIEIYALQQEAVDQKELCKIPQNHNRLHQHPVIEEGFKEDISVKVHEDSAYKAPRLDASSVKVNDAVVGKNGCDLTQVMSLITAIKKRIDILKQLICEKFAFTWTILEEIEEDIFNTKTVLCDKFVGTWTILEEIQDDFFSCCTLLEAEIFNTKTVLCDKFVGTWTILEDIQDDMFNCCTLLEAEIFNTKTVLCDKFVGTWTILEEIQDDMFNCCTLLEAEIFNTKTVLCDKFVGTWTILEDILNEIVSFTCPNFDLSGVFTVLEEIEVDIFNTKTVLCDKFVGTWTILEEIQNDMFNCCTLLEAEILNTKTVLCDKFVGTWTILEEIQNDIFNCCTLLEAEIFNTKTVLCDKFVGTWTILESISSQLPEMPAFVSVFGDQIVSGREDFVSIQFQYGISDFDTISTVMLTGTVSSSQSMAIINAGTNTNGFAQLQSKRNLRYRPGHEGYVFFTALFQDGGQADSTQWIGLFDAGDGAAIGYNDTDFALLFRRGGIDTIVTQTNFNRDPLNGTGPSGITINTANLNVFRISYGWLGSAPIKYQILRNDGVWVTFHIIEFPNSSTGPSFLNPVLPITAQVRKVNGSMNNLRIATASWNSGLIGEPSFAGSRFFSVNSALIILPTTAEAHVITIRNKTTFQSVPNKVEVRVALVSGGTADTASEVSVIRLRRNATVTGLSFMNVNAANSVVEFSTAGSLVAGTGTVELSAVNNSFGSGPLLEFLPANYPIILLPGDSITLTGQSLSGGGNEFIASIGWEELF